MEPLINLNREISVGLQKIIHDKTGIQLQIKANNISPLSYSMVDCYVEVGCSDRGVTLCYGGDIDEGDIHITINIIVITKELQRKGIFTEIINFLDNLSDKFNIASIYYDNIVNNIVYKTLLKHNYTPRTIMSSEDLYAMLKVFKK